MSPLYSYLRDKPGTVTFGMLVLSLVWFVTTLRSKSPLSSRRFGIHNIVLLVLLLAHDIPSF